MGRKVAQIIIMTTLTALLREYYISVPEGVNKEALLEMKNLLTLTPADPDVRLIFRKRRG